MKQKNRFILSALASLLALSQLPTLALAQDPRSVEGAILESAQGQPSGTLNMCTDPTDNRFFDVTGPSLGITNIGDKVWDLIVNNDKPIGVDYTRIKAHALPKGVSDPMQMDTWCGQTATPFELRIRNIFGATLFSGKVKVHFDYGAAYNGKGKHLANVMVVPDQLYTAIGITANAKVEVSDPVYRAGRVATLRLVVQFNIRGPINAATLSKTLEIRGDGSVSEL